MRPQAVPRAAHYRSGKKGNGHCPPRIGSEKSDSLYDKLFFLVDKCGVNSIMVTQGLKMEVGKKWQYILVTRRNG